MLTHEYFQISKDNYEAFDFDKLDLNELEKAIDIALENAKKSIAILASESEPHPTFENTIMALESSDEDLDRVLNILYNLFSSDTNDHVQQLVEKYSPLLAEYSNSIVLNEALFKKVKYVFDNELKSLDEESSKLVEKYFKDFTKNGANLNDEDKEKLKKIDQKLSTLSPIFSKNSLDATNAFKWGTDDEKDLEGLPKYSIEAALDEAKEKKYDKKYLFTLQYPSLLPMLKYNKNRHLREMFYKANAFKAVEGKHSNQETIKEMIHLRDQKAKLLGFDNYAEFILESRMAKSPKTVFTFLDDLKKHCLEPAKKEVKEVKDFAKETDGLNDFMPWDFSYYSEKLREKKYSFSEEEIKPYFPLDQVLDGAFLHAQKLYDVTFKENKNISVYHPDVRAFEVWNTNDESDFIGVFFTDFFPRESKRSGAWCTHFRSQGLLKGELKRPHVSIVCNFTKPTKESPSLLTFNEVRTLFHEFGHALHELLSQCKYRSLSGTSVYWDFVELPSQIMENWTLEEESLNLFAKHYKTGEVIPKDYVKKIKEAESYLAGYNCIRQIRFSYLDMLYHTTDPTKILNVVDFEKEATKELSLLPELKGASFSCSFGHIFAGGYAAGYYSYKWAEVLDADAFEFFKEKGVFNKEVSTAFKKNILEKGGTKDPDVLYKNFRGREPDVKALLRRDKLI